MENHILTHVVMIMAFLVESGLEGQETENLDVRFEAIQLALKTLLLNCAIPNWRACILKGKLAWND